MSLPTVAAGERFRMLRDSLASKKKKFFDSISMGLAKKKRLPSIKPKAQKPEEFQ